MTILDLLLGWFILTTLGVGSLVAAEPFWGPRRARRQAAVIRLDRSDQRPERDERAPQRRAA